MKKKEKRMIAILIIVAVIIIAIIYFATRPSKEEQQKNTTENATVEEFVQVLEDGTKLNTSSKLSEAKNINGLVISNIQLTELNGQCTLLADVVNNSSADTDILLINITLYDKQGNELAVVPGIISPIKVGESTQLNAGITTDYANAYDFKVTMR